MVDSIQAQPDPRPVASPQDKSAARATGAQGFGTALAQALQAGAQSSGSNTQATTLMPPRANPLLLLPGLRTHARWQPALRVGSALNLMGGAAYARWSPPAGTGQATASSMSSANFVGPVAAHSTLPTATGPGGPLALAGYPRPTNDNGRGIHWIPTTQQSTEVVDRFMDRLKALNVRWVTFLNKADDLAGNEYLVKRLTEAGIMPVMRIYSEGTEPIQADLSSLVKHYKALGVSYFQLFNEPNLNCENQGQAPDPERYAEAWVKAARQVVKAGGLPGLAPLSPSGDVDDLTFLRQSLQAIKAQGGTDLLQRSWASVHNYGQDYLRVRQYDQTIRDVLGYSLPQIGTEAGIYTGKDVSEADQVRIVSGAYDYLQQREPYYFAYSLWCLANQAGGGHDQRWEDQALYRLDGPTALAQALEQDAASSAQA